MIPPIFVYEPVDLDIFDTVAAAELYCEAWIVSETDIQFFDSEGRPLSVRPGINETIKITCDPTMPPRPAELAEAIRQFLLAIGKSADELAELTLPALIEIAYPVARHHK